MLKKQRKCLVCERYFNSAGPQVRTCSKCKRTYANIRDRRDWLGREGRYSISPSVQRELRQQDNDYYSDIVGDYG